MCKTTILNVVVSFSPYPSSTVNDNFNDLTSFAGTGGETNDTTGAVEVGENVIASPEIWPHWYVSFLPTSGVVDLRPESVTFVFSYTTMLFARLPCKKYWLNVPDLATSVV